ncbi:MAG: hypothetical protein KDJ29_15680, partial [Hyphomicrobiales bacterium]|nr:hypothetical protein [Hyphomicrobiales bacterium]
RTLWSFSLRLLCACKCLQDCRWGTGIRFKRWKFLPFRINIRFDDFPGGNQLGETGQLGKTGRLRCLAGIGIIRQCDFDGN